MGRVILHWIGADSATSEPYLLWSGFIGNLSVVFAVISAPVVLYRRNNCEVRRCWRIARHDMHDPEHNLVHHLCRQHHPEHPGKQITARELRRVCHLYFGDQPGEG